MRFRLIVLLLTASLYWLTSHFAKAMAMQDYGVVEGEVWLIDVDAKGNVNRKPAKDELVYAYGPSTPSVLTNDKGFFYFRGLKPALWKIVAYVDGYKQMQEYKVDVGAEKKSRYPIMPERWVELRKEGRTGALREGTRIILALYRTSASVRGPDAAGQKPFAGQKDKCEVGAAELRGRVVNPEEKGVGGARISAQRIQNDSGQLSELVSATTEKSGDYILCVKGISKQETYILMVTKSGYNRFLTLTSERRPPPDIIKLEEEDAALEDPLIEKTEATRRHVFSPQLMETLPIPGLRSFDTFALLAPGVAPPPETPNTRGPGISPGLGTAGQFTVNGLRSRENNFTVDGSDNNDEDIGTRRQGFVALAPQSIESLSEFQIVTALGDARFGRNIGGRVSALTKSGSPEFHGSLYGFLTDGRLNARDFFDQTTGNNPASFSLKRQSDGADVLLNGRPIVSPNPVGGENPFTRTQLGFAVGGPVEKLGAFFFITLERVKSRASRESHFVVPTVEQRGVFEAGGTGLLGAPGNTLPLFPATLPGDAIFSLYPFPNNPLGPFGRNTYTTVLPANAKGTRLSAKLDRQFGTHSVDKSRPPWSFFNGGDNLTGRYNFSQETSTIPVTGEALFSSLRPSVRTKNIAFYLNRQLTRRVSDVIRFSFGRTKLTFDEVRDPFLSPSSFFPGEPFLLNAPLLINVTAPLPSGTLTQPSYLSASSQQGAALLTSLGYPVVTHAEQLTGPLGQVIIPGFSPLGVDVYNFPQSRANNTFQIADTVTYVSRDNQIFTFGVDVRKTEINSTLERNRRPLAVFGGLRTSMPSSDFEARLPGGAPLAPRVFSGTTLAAAGVPTGLSQTLAVTPNSTVGIRFTQASFFGQTDWRVGKDLNINLGARFNYLTQLSTKGNTFKTAFDPAELERQGQAAIEDCFRISGNRAECDRVAKAIISSFPADLKTPFARERFDLDVRAGLAWSLDDRTVVRGGISTYAGEFPGIVIGQSRNAFPGFLPLNFAAFPVLLPNNSGNQAFLFNPANPILRQSEPTLAIEPGTLNTLLPNINAISFLTTRLVVDAGQRPFSSNVLGLDLVLPQSELQNPYSLQYAVTLERRLGRSYAISVAYVGTRGIKLLRLSTPRLGLNRNRLLEPPGLTVTTQGGLSFPPFGGAFPRFDGVILPPQESVPNTQLAIARTSFESSASSTYNSLQVEFRKQYARRFQFRTAFTYSHTIDDVSDFFDTAGAFTLPQDSLHRSERASSNFDVRLRSVTHFIRDFPKDLFFSGPTRLGGWQLAGIITAQTGQPFTVNSVFDINRDGNLTDRLDSTTGLIRGDVAGDRSVQLSLALGTNPLTLLAADGRDGAVGRNTFRAPSQFNFDLSVTKFFNFNDRVRFHARTEIFDLFNRANFGIPVRILESPAFGKSTYTTTPPRTVQFVFKLLF